MTVTAPAAPTRTCAQTRRHELAVFLRSRRERIQPQDVGLVAGGRRRTPGLRREELAGLAGVGVTWYTWLEQGRDINVSAQVLEAIGRALRLDRYEQAHLVTLAGLEVAPPASACAAVPPEVRPLLEQVMPFPAVVLSERMDLLAWNPAYGRLFGDLDAVPEADRNALWLFFTHPDWQAATVERDRACTRLVATYRAAMARHLHDSSWQVLVDRLCARSETFRSLWARHDVGPPRAAVKLVDNPYVGLVRLQTANLYLQDRPGLRLTTYSPLDDDSRERLERLVAGA